MKFAHNKLFGTPATGILQKVALAVLGAIAALMTSTGVFAQEDGKQKTFQKNYTVAAIYDYAARGIEITVSTGCISSSLRHMGNNINFSIDEERALITGTGYFAYGRLSKSKFAKADCMGAAKQTFKLPNVEQRRYTVIVNGKYRGVLDFTRSGKPPRLTTKSNKTNLSSKTKINNTYAPVNLENWTPRNADSVMELFHPITKGHPESLEGRPEMEISMRTGPNSVTVNITSYGYLDDSVAGGKYRGVVTRKDGRWYLDSLWQQNLCARGKKAGQWSKTPCL